MMLGSSDAWRDFLAPVVPKALRLVYEAWCELPPPARDALEDDITRRLWQRMKQHPRRDEYEFRIVMQHTVDEGKPDLAFLPYCSDDEVYFCLECKRLQVAEGDGVRAGYSAYVLEGMMRFVDGRYALNVEFGGMVGYVLDGDLANAVDGVSGSISGHRERLCTSAECEGLEKSDLGLPALYQTRHARLDANRISRPLTLVHLFLAHSVSNRPIEGRPRAKKAQSKKSRALRQKK